MNREGFHDWRREHERETIIRIGALCIGTYGMQQETRRSDDNCGAYDGSSDDGGTNDGSPD